ncbi:IS66 family transposase [Thermoleptolyngbya oregonensis NK1-22]|uniref:IS66 family transposase n=1 Tax=Thermoleptolyngbya oregonensis NK1-22 TaxID=2547457 RepID=A0AA96Y5M0_9CYAN|nr:IS66 family transposase [Thermoleptolyngbya oregonensis]WOB42318.1 IS66 family transposase [Thermoleptolyngbya oregonensis NK1-22]WOB42357.1 IS66 family transposase [Thermoleptolyngbya oregonensis NK1-22]
MKELPPLDGLSHSEKDALISGLWQELQTLRAEVEKLKQKRVKKTSKNSSLPPSQGFKPNQSRVQSTSVKGEETRHHRNGGRTLSQQPDQVVIAQAKSCPHCGVEVDLSMQRLSGIYERIELPRLTPHITRVERYGGTCQCCQKAYEAPVPVGLEPGSPFGTSVASLVTYLRYSHAISYQRLSHLMGDLYGLKLSEGAIANLLQRVQGQLETPIAKIVERLRSARLVGSDETGARVNGKNQWEWVFQNDQVCLHVIRPTRGKTVIDTVMAGHQPQIWVSDLFSAQAAHPAQDWQVCLAHQLRDCQYAIDAGDDLFAPRMKRLLLKAIALQRRRQILATSTVEQYCARLGGSLREILNLQPKSVEGQRLLKRYQKIHAHLLLFLTDEAIPPTNNASEQALRWSVIFRKVTNGFRSDWGAELFAQVRSLVNTAKRQGISAFDAISRALTSHQFDWLLG